MVQFTQSKAEVAQARGWVPNLNGAIGLHPQLPLPSLLLPPGHVGNSFQLLPPWYLGEKEVQDHVTNP